MRAEHALGDLARAAVVMIIKTRLTNADAARVLRQRDQLFEGRLGLLMRLMRMRAHREPDIVIGFGNRAIAVVTADEGRDGDQPSHASGFRARNDSVAFFCELGKVEMAMAVDQHQSFTPATSAST